MNNCYELFRRVFLRKIGIIILTAFIGSGALILEKSLTSDFMVQTGDFAITALVKIDDPDNKNLYIEPDYKKILESNENYYDFLSSYDNKYNFNKVYGDWKTLKGIKKYEWMKKHFTIADAHNGIVEFVVQIKENEPKDVDYLSNNADNLMTDFIGQSEKTVKMVHPQAQFRIVDKAMILPENVPLSKRKVITKYGIIGFILGGCLATAVLFIKALGKQR